VITIAAFVISLAAGQPAHAASPDACALLSDADIHAALGEDVRARTPATQPAGSLLMAQCYFGAASARSVSLSVAARAASGPPSLTPREYWRRQFHADDRRRKKRDAGGEGGARPIAGIGDEAYWSGNRIAGALYVLSGETFIRVSVGGLTAEQERIGTSKRLAQAAMARLEK